MKIAKRHDAGRLKGFTIVEVLVGLLIFILVAASVVWGMRQLNYFASVSRLYTAAQTLAQNQIDLVLTKTPYNPGLNQYPTPNVLQTSPAPYYSDPSTPNTLYDTSHNVPIYYYNSGGTQVNVVMGTIATTVVSMNSSLPGLNLRRATVVVSYTYRNQQFSIKMDTIRAPDV